MNKRFDPHKMATQYLHDKEVFKDEGVDTQLITMYLYSAYNAGKLDGYEDARDNAWWHAQEEDQFDEAFFGSTDYMKRQTDDTEC